MKTTINLNQTTGTLELDLIELFSNLTTEESINFLEEALKESKEVRQQLIHRFNDIFEPDEVDTIADHLELYTRESAADQLEIGEVWESKKHSEQQQFLKDHHLVEKGSEDMDDIWSDMDDTDRQRFLDRNDLLEILNPGVDELELAYNNVNHKTRFVKYVLSDCIKEGMELSNLLVNIPQEQWNHMAALYLFDGLQDHPAKNDIVAHANLLMKKEITPQQFAEVVAVKFGLISKEPKQFSADELGMLFDRLSIDGKAEFVTHVFIDAFTALQTVKQATA